MSTNQTQSEKRKRAQKLGRAMEAWAALWLMLRGERVLARNFKTPVGEIDIVTRRGNTVSFIEVKARPGLDAALAAVTAAQRRRIEQAAELFLVQRPALQACDIRFSVLAAAGWLGLSLIRDAWRPGD